MSYPYQPDQPQGAPKSRRGRNLAVTLALLGAGVGAGAIIASAVGANAQSTTTTTPSTSSAAAGSGTSSSTATPGRPPANGQRPANAHGANPVRSDEKSVDAATAAKLK